MFKAVFSRQFKDYAEAQIASSGVPVVVTLPAAAAAAASADELPSCTFKLAYWAAAALLYTTFAQLPDIAKQLSNVYSKAQLDSIGTRLAAGDHAAHSNYAVLRACAALRQRDVQLPSQVALLAYISQSRLAFEQYANWLGKTAPRPETAAAEVHGHSYSLGAGGAVELEYLVFQKRPLWRAGVAPELGSRAYFAEQYGELSDAAAVEPLFEPTYPVIAAAFERGCGGEPATSVPMQLVVADGTALFESDVQALRTFSGRYIGAADNGVRLATVCRVTVAQHTQFRLFGRPKVESQTVLAAATDGGEWAMPEAEEEEDAMDAGDDGGDPEAEAFKRFLGQFLLNPSEAAVVATVAARGQTVASLFETLRPGRQAGTAAEFDRARAVVVTLCEVVVTGAIQLARALAAQEEHEQAMAAAEAAANEAVAAADEEQEAEDEVGSAADEAADEQDAQVVGWAAGGRLRRRE